MLRNITIQSFKSIVDLKIELGRVNVFVGANGSGKSNILEAIGVLGAAASGRVDDESLLRRGVRPGVPDLYKAAFKLDRTVTHIKFGATSHAEATYDITLWNPRNDPSPAWKFKTEWLGVTGAPPVASRSPRNKEKYNPEQGLAALEIARTPSDDASAELLSLLREFAIHCPNTPTLRGLIPDQQSRAPVGLAGGRLPEAIGELRSAAVKDEALRECLDDASELIDWAADFREANSASVPLSPSAARSPHVVQFVDRFMLSSRNRLTGYDASEGALYVLFYAALALHPKAARCVAVDNLDQALNPRLASQVAAAVCRWTKIAPQRQWLLTSHNPAVLDGLPIHDPEVRLFIVERNNRGHTCVRRIDVEALLAKRPDSTWTVSRMWTAGLLGGMPDV